MRSRLFLRLLAAFALVIVAATVTLDFSVRRAWENSLRQEIDRSLRQKTLMFANRVNTDSEHNLQDLVSQVSHAAGARATVIDVTGKVLADSEAAPSVMENLGQTPEFAAALKGEVGTDTRASQKRGNRIPLCGRTDFRRSSPFGRFIIRPWSRHIVAS